MLLIMTFYNEDDEEKKKQNIKFHKIGTISHHRQSTLANVRNEESYLTLFIHTPYTRSNCPFSVE